MSPTQILDKFKQAAEAARQQFEAEMKKLRTGRAHPSMLDGIMVMAYGSPMPLIQTATVSAPEAQLLQITPFDPNNLQAIAEAIRNDASLGLNPTDDGRVVRVPIPPLNEERRRDIVKQLSEKKEDTLVRLRQSRHEALDAAKTAKSDKTIGEDDLARLEKQVEDAMNAAKTAIEDSAKSREQEIMTL